MQATPPQEVRTPFFEPSPFAGLSCADERRREIRVRLVRWTVLVAFQVAALLVLLEFASHAAADHCFFKDMLYSDGDVACRNSSEYRCDGGEWRALGLSCTPDGSVVVSRPCELGGISFASRAASCQAGKQFRCDDGTWKRLAIPCPVGDAPIEVAPVGRSCTFEGAIVAHGSAICRSGSTFLCRDGEWDSLDTSCG